MWIYIFIILLASCTTPSGWVLSHTQGSKQYLESTRLVYPTSDEVNGLTVEIVYTEKKTETYLVARSGHIPFYQDNPKQTLLKFITQEHIEESIAYRRKGGQRVLLPENIQKKYIAALLQGFDVTFVIQGYSSTIASTPFIEEYRKCQEKQFNIFSEIGRYTKIGAL